MILHEFPNLGWLKSQIARNFDNCRGWGNYTLDRDGFPSVIIHTTTRECFRPNVKGPFSFFYQLHRRDAAFDALIHRIIRSYKDHGFDKLLFTEQLVDLLTYHLQQHRDITDIIQKLPPARLSTRIQLYKQLSHAMDAIHSNPGNEPGLEELSKEAHLSKFHFLRLFRSAYGFSPHQYIQHLRLEKARTLLTQTKTPVSDLADLLGFANSQSFTRLFSQRMGVPPSQYRLLTK